MDTPSFACGMCGKCFSDAEQCKLHIQSHIGQKPFRCVICWPLFYDMSNNQQSGASPVSSQPSGPSLDAPTPTAKAVTSPGAAAELQTVASPKDNPASQTAASSKYGAAPSPPAVTAEAPELPCASSDSDLVSTGPQEATSVAASQNVAHVTTGSSQREAHVVAPDPMEGALVGVMHIKEHSGTTSTTSPKEISVPQVTLCGMSTRTSSETDESVGDRDFSASFQTSADSACSPDEVSESKPVIRVIYGDSLPLSAAGTNYSAAPAPMEDDVVDVKIPASLMGSSSMSTVTVEITSAPRYSAGDLAASRDFVNPLEMHAGEMAGGKGENTLCERTEHCAERSDENQVDALDQTPTSVCKGGSSLPNSSGDSLAYRGRRKKGKPRRLVGEMPVPVYMVERLCQEASVCSDHIYSSLCRKHVTGLSDQHRSAEARTKITTAKGSEHDGNRHKVPKHVTTQETLEKNASPDEIQTHKRNPQQAEVRVCQEETQDHSITPQAAESRFDSSNAKETPGPVNFQGVISFLRSVQLRNPPGNEAQSNAASKSRAATKSSAGPSTSRTATPDSTTSPGKAAGVGNTSPCQVSSTVDGHSPSSSAENITAMSWSISLEGESTGPQDASLARKRAGSLNASIEGTVVGPQNASAAIKRESPHATSAEGRSTARKADPQEGPSSSPHRSGVDITAISKDSASDASTQTRYSTTRTASKDSASGATTQAGSDSHVRAVSKKSISPGTSTLTEVTRSPGATASRVKPTSAATIQPVQFAKGGPVIQVDLASSETVAAHHGADSPKFIHITPPVPPSIVPAVITGNACVMPHDSSPNRVSRSSTAAAALPKGIVSASTEISPATPSVCTVDQNTVSTMLSASKGLSSSATSTWSKTSSAVSTGHVSGSYSGIVPAVNSTSSLSVSSAIPAFTTGVPTAESSSRNPSPAKQAAKTSESPTAARHSPGGTSQENMSQGPLQTPSHLPCSVEALRGKRLTIPKVTTKNPYVPLPKVRAPALDDLHAGKAINISLNKPVQSPVRDLVRVEPCESPIQGVHLDSLGDLDDDEASGSDVSDSDEAVLFSDDKSLPDMTGTSSDFKKSGQPNQGQNVCTAKQGWPQKGTNPENSTVPSPCKVSQSVQLEKLNNSHKKSSHSLSSQQGQLEKPQTPPEPGSSSPQTLTSQRGYAPEGNSEKDLCAITCSDEEMSEEDLTSPKPFDRANARKTFSGHTRSDKLRHQKGKQMDTESQEQAKTSNTSKVSKSGPPNISHIAGKSTEMQEAVEYDNDYHTEATKDTTVQSKDEQTLQSRTSQSNKTANSLSDSDVVSCDNDTGSRHEPVSSTGAEKGAVQNTPRESEVVGSRLQPATNELNLEPLSAEKPAHTPPGPQTTQPSETGEMAVNTGTPGPHVQSSPGSRKRPAEAGAGEQKKKRKPRVSAEKLLVAFPEVQFDLQELFTPVHKLRHRSSEPRDTTSTENSSRDGARPVSTCSRYADEDSLNASDLPVTFAHQTGNGKDGSSPATQCHSLGSEYNPAFPSALVDDGIFEENLELPHISSPRRRRQLDKNKEQELEKRRESPDRGSEGTSDEDSSGEQHKGTSGKHHKGKSGEHRRKPAQNAKPSATVTSRTGQGGAPETLGGETLRNGDHVLHAGVNNIRSFTMSAQGDGRSSSSSTAATAKTGRNMTCKTKRPLSRSSKTETVKFRSRNRQISLGKTKKRRKTEKGQSATETSKTTHQIFTPSVAESVKRAENRRKSALQFHPSPDLETTTAQIAKSIATSVLSEISPFSSNHQMHKTKKGVEQSETSKPSSERSAQRPDDSVHVSPGHFSHGKVSQYECKKCDAKFKKYTNYRLHLKNHGRDRFACEVCGSTFGRKETLKTHRMIHTGEAAVDCIICGKTLSGLASLTTHMRIHTDERPYSCPFCPRTFRQQSALTSHCRVHTRDRPFKCNMCSKSYRFHKNLYNHRFTHTGERRYVCTICDAAYYQVSALNVHLKVHTGERPFACNLCSMRFIQKAHLAKHLRHRHEKEVCAMQEREAKNVSKPYRCGGCGQSFTSFFSKGRHVKFFCIAIFATEQAQPAQ